MIRGALFCLLGLSQAISVVSQGCPVGCSSHGICRQGLCECSSGWAGQDCSYFLATSSDLEAAEDALEDGGCLLGCSSHGVCQANRCQCHAGWSGPACNVASECPPACTQPRGECVLGSCRCSVGFFGPDCTEALCLNNCWGHGTCVGGTCQCSSGWIGPDCGKKHTVASACDPPCANGGQCVNGQCYCSQGFTGVDCSQLVHTHGGTAFAAPARTPPSAAASVSHSHSQGHGQSPLGASGGAGAGALPPAALRPEVQQLQPVEEVQQQQPIQHSPDLPRTVGQRLPPLEELPSEQGPLSPAQGLHQSEPQVQPPSSPLAGQPQALPPMPLQPLQPGPPHIQQPGTPPVLQQDPSVQRHVPAPTVQGGHASWSQEPFRPPQPFQSPRPLQPPQPPQPPLPPRPPAPPQQLQPQMHASTPPRVATPSFRAATTSAPPQAQFIYPRTAPTPLPDYEWSPGALSMNLRSQVPSQPDWVEPERLPMQPITVQASLVKTLKTSAGHTGEPKPDEAVSTLEGQVAAMEQELQGLEDGKVTGATTAWSPSGHAQESPAQGHGVPKNLSEAGNVSSVGNGSTSNGTLVSNATGAGSVALETGLEAVRRVVRAAGDAADRLWHAAKDRLTGDDEPAVVVGLQEDRKVATRAKTSAQVPPTTPAPVMWSEPTLTLAPATPSPSSLLSYQHSEGMVATNHTPTSCGYGCSGHGVCIGSEAMGRCRCHEGWTGEVCDMPRCPLDCHGQGLCLRGHCVCQEGFFGTSCSHHRCPNDCSGSGYCFHGKCHCMAGFTGADCARIQQAGQTLRVKLQRVAVPQAAAGVDTSHSIATLRKMPKPTCPQRCNDRGTCQQDGTCSCWSGYSGTACETHCPNECSQQGSCLEGACLCFAGFVGVDCSVKSCCSGHGSCEDIEVCKCDAGWGGENCEVRLTCADPTCSGHGNCVEGRCECNAGFGGHTCALPGGGCSPLCGAHGICDAATKKCVCAEGFVGADCTVGVRACPNHCSNKGLCLNGQCMCGAGWAGEDCSRRFFVPGSSAKDLKNSGGPPRGDSAEAEAEVPGAASLLLGNVGFSGAPTLEEPADAIAKGATALLLGGAPLQGEVPSTDALLDSRADLLHLPASNTGAQLEPITDADLLHLGDIISAQHGQAPAHV